MFMMRMKILGEELFELSRHISMHGENSSKYELGGLVRSDLFEESALKVHTSTKEFGTMTLWSTWCTHVMSIEININSYLMKQSFDKFINPIL